MITRVLSNQRSKSAGRYLPALQAALPPTDAVQHVVTHDLAELRAVFTQTAWRSEDLLVINGGDGSVQQALSQLNKQCPPQRWPRVAILPSGTTNMTAYDVNEQRDFERCLASLRYMIDQPQQTSERRRALVQVSSPSVQAVGFFFGAGTIVQGIKYFHQRVSPKGGGHELGAGVALLRTLWGIAKKQPPFSDSQRICFDGPDLTSAIAQAEHVGEEPPQYAMTVRLCCITGLDRLFLGIRPYWGGTTGALRGTVVEAQARNFIWNMPRLLRGKPSARMQPDTGYHSSKLDNLRLAFAGPFTLDGELYDNADEILSVRASVPVRILSL